MEMNKLVPIDIKKERSERKGAIEKTPFKHQQEAFAKLNEFFEEGNAKSKGGLLVLPTGAGKTFTMVKWLYDYALPKNAKVIWLAHTFHLLDQAYLEFWDNSIFVRGRDQLYINEFSGNPYHLQAFQIDPDLHDVVIMTSQTAIRQWDIDSLRSDGTKPVSKFEKLIQENKESPLYLVLDEAHHAPAFGCRKLLMGIREAAPDINFIGLTATPTYHDETRRGWLKKLFGDIIYEANKDELLLQKILARPNFIPKPTNMEYDLADEDYQRIVREHKEIPEKIIEKLAEDAARNDFIVETYAEKKEEYGKTIIFADRWYQPTLFTAPLNSALSC